MKQIKNWVVFLVVSLSACSAYSSSNAQFKQTPVIADKTKQRTFVGCIDYNVTYIAVPTEDAKRKDKAEFVITITKKNNGDKRTICFNHLGDWLHIYKNGEQLDRVWYFADKNEEYTFFKNGVLKFSVNDVAEPEGFSELGIEQMVRTKEIMTILGLEVNKIIVKKLSGTVENFWVSEDFIRNPKSYRKNKLGFTNELYAYLEGVPLYQKKTVADLMITILEAKEIREGEPDETLFKLPAVTVYPW